MSNPRHDVAASMRYLAAQRASDTRRREERRAARKCVRCGLADAPPGTRCKDCRTTATAKRAARVAP
jgi:uncharacterized OB-fold protein